jgi:PAS domain S-box-containing protein
MIKLNLKTKITLVASLLAAALLSILAFILLDSFQQSIHQAGHYALLALVVPVCFSVAGVVVMFFDISERKQAENTLRETKEFLESVVQNATVPCFLLDANHMVLFWNRACEALTGVKAADVVGTTGHWRAFYDHERPCLADLSIDGKFDDMSKYYTICGRSAMNPDGMQSEGWRHLNGSDRYVMFDAAPIRNARGELVAALETIQDITERKRAEDMSRRIAANLKESNEEIRSFAYIVSHDLRAPLVNLKGFSGELSYALRELAPVFAGGVAPLAEKERQKMEDLYQKDVPEALEFIDSSVNRMERLINAILKLSRLGRQDMKPERVVMEQVVASITKSLRHQIEQRRTTLTIGTLPDIVADRTVMEQIMGNLLDNAVKYLEPDRPGRIEINAETSSDSITFHVRDNGRGIAEEEMGKVFEIFRRAGRQDMPGEGMGLAYVKTLVRRQGGSIQCASQLGEGTTFSFTIPMIIRFKEHEQGVLETDGSTVN